MKWLTLSLSLLSALAQSQTVKLGYPDGHSSSISSVHFSHNSKHVISTSGNEAKLWESETGKLIHTLKGHNNKIYSNQIYSADFSPDDKLILLSSKDHTATIWNKESGELVSTLVGHTGEVNIGIFSPDGLLVITASDDRTINIWDSSTGELIRSLEGHQQVVSSLDVSRDSKLIVSGSWDGTIKVWDTKNGNLIRDFPGTSKYNIKETHFSPDTRDILSVSQEGLAKVWDINTGQIKFIIGEGTFSVLRATFSPNGKYIGVIHKNNWVRVFNSETGNEIITIKNHKDKVGSIYFSSDSEILISASNDNTIKLWRTIDFTLIKSISVNAPQAYAEITSDKKRIVSFGEGNSSAWIFSADSGQTIQTLFGNPDRPSSVFFDPLTKYLVTANGWWSWSSRTNLYDFSTGQLKHTVDGSGWFSENGEFLVTQKNDLSSRPSKSLLSLWSVKKVDLISPITSVSNSTTGIFSDDVNYFLASSRDSIRIINLKTGLRTSATMTLSSSLMNIGPQDKNYLLVESKNNCSVLGFSKGNTTKRKLIELDSIAVVSTDFTLTSPATNKEISPDNKYLLTIDYLKNPDSIHIYSLATGKIIDKMLGVSAKFSDNGKFFAIADRRQAKIFKGDRTKLLAVIDSKFDEGFPVVKFSPGSDYLFIQSDTSQLLIRTIDFKQIFSTPSFEGELRGFRFLKKSNVFFRALYSDKPVTRFYSLETGQVIREIPGTLHSLNNSEEFAIVNDKGEFCLYDLRQGSLLLKLFFFGEGSVIFYHPSGLFDATPGSFDKLYFTSGIDVIEFGQLKARYYEPGLWKKVLNREKLRSVMGFKSIDLPPDIRVGQVDEKGYLQIDLTNRGGGIGEVNISVNYKEIIKDARNANINYDAPSASIKVFIGKHKNIVKGQENLIAVRAWNKDHWVVSRGQVISYHSKEIESYKPSVHILTCGVSDYTGNEIDLKYAAKDANDVSVALQLGAEKLFGAERSHVYNLTTSQPKELYPTKINILKALERISSIAHPLDIFVMYVSGHGINYGGQDSDWHYLTQEAYTGSASAYNDPSIRQQTTISSNELVELFKKVPALKQVLIIDACASGKVVDNLMVPKDIESSTLRALDRMRDRTGMHIITGCTADAVSYEASKYGQGVLTYSLLEGIRGAALREDQYVDVNRLFQYAQDRVPQLAEGIGGIQSPQIFSPQGSQSFDIGLLSDVEKKEIPIAKIRPVYIRSNFQDEIELEDVLGLSKVVDESLNEVSVKGADASLIFVDVREYPDACKLIGRYRKEKGEIILKLRKKCATEDKTYELKAVTIEGLRTEILKVL